MYIYQSKELVRILTLYFYTYGISLLIITTTIITTYELQLYKNNITQPDLIYYIRGTEHFQPCTEQLDPIYPMAKMIICKEGITSQFGKRLPIIIQPDNKCLISTIRIENNPNIEICATGTFENVMNDPTGIAYRGVIERKLIITGLSLHIFHYGCLKGLSELEVLYIENQPGGELKKLSGNLLQELKNLRNLKSLHLENIDMSIGIPQYAFHGWIKQLKIITLINNNLNVIHDEAFPLSATESKLVELRIERQAGDGWKLLNNSYKWGKYLHTLKVFSLDGTNLRVTKDIILSSSQLRNVQKYGKTNLKIDLGDYVNRNLEHLNIQNCGLTDLTDDQESKDVFALNLFHLGGQLKQLYIGFNLFSNFNFLNAIKKFHNLQLLSINSNQIPLERLPDSFSLEWPYLNELQLTSNGLNYIPVNSISSNLKVLHLSENPLKLFDNNWIKLHDGEVRLNELHLNSIRLISVQLEGGKANWDKIFQPIRSSIEHLSLINCQLEANMLLVESTYPKNESSKKSQENIHDHIYLNLGLTHFRRLKSLILSGNYLEYIPPAIFQSLNELNSLVLTQNQLLTIQEYKVENETDEENQHTSTDTERHLLRLDLSYNLLVTMERCGYALGLRKSFESIIPLKPTWFAENEDYKYQSTTENFGYKVYESNHIYWLGGLNIIGNPFVCDCRLAWFRHFINKMSKQFTENERQYQQIKAHEEKQFITTNKIPFGFQKYLNEAVNFTCYGANKWTGRNFLTLTPNDLYTENHVDCQRRPDIYGQDMESLEKLQPCWKLNRTLGPNLEEILETRQGMMFQSSVRKTMYGSSSITESATTISSEAYTLIIIAGIAALCFIIISIIIIIWLCIRLRRNTQKHIISVPHRRKFLNDRLIMTCKSLKKSECYSLPNCNLFTACSNCTNKQQCIQTCSFCGCPTNHRMYVSSTSETGQLMRPNSQKSEDNNLIQTSMLGNNTNDIQQLNDERVISSDYSEVTDLETQSLNRFLNCNNSYKRSELKSQAHRNKQRKKSYSKETKYVSECFEDEKKCILQVRKISQPDLSINSYIRGWDSNRSIGINGKPLHISASVQTLLQINSDQPMTSERPIPSAPLPPLPAPRKSKSIGDLQLNTRIESPIHLPTGIMPFNLRRSAKQLAMRKVGEQQTMHPQLEASINLLRHYDTKKKRSPISTASIRRSTLPWRDRSLDNNEIESIKAGKSIPTSSRASLKGVFRRTRLIVSARARLENNEKSSIDLRNNWLSASRRKIEQTCKWLKRDRTSKLRASHPLTRAQQPHSENDVKFIGPDLPKPFFLLPRQEAEYATPFIEPKDTRHTDYLPMCHDNYIDNKPTILSIGKNSMELINNNIRSENKKSPIDEYVTDLIHVQQINYPTMLLSSSYKSASQPQLPPIASVKTLQPTTTTTLDIVNTSVITPTTSGQPITESSNNNKPIRPPRHQKLQITGDMYSIQAIPNSINNLNSGSESNKNKKNDKYCPLDYELPLPPPPPPPPFMLDKSELIKSNANKVLFGGSINSSKTDRDTTEVNVNNNNNFLRQSPLLSSLTTHPKPTSTNIRPLRSARFPQSTTTKITRGDSQKLNLTTDQKRNQ